MGIYRPHAIPPALTNIMMGLHRDDAERLEAAFQIAAQAHDGQVRDEGTPFIDHPVAVVEILYNELGCRDVDVLVAALNHDVLEDAACVTDGFLTSAIGDRATVFVRNVTKEKVPEREKSQRDARYMERLRNADHHTKLLKLADRIHNLRSIPKSDDRDKAQRYLSVSRAEFIPIALGVDHNAADRIREACDEIEEMLIAEGLRVDESTL